MNTKWMSGIIAWAIASLLSTPVLGADWSFVMLGDTRGEGSTTTTGVSPYLNTIAQKIATLSPELVLVAGDLINGNDIPSGSPLENYSLQFTNWQSAMAPIFNYTSHTGIPIYPVRGNHDNNDSEGAPIEALKQAYYDAFSAYVPANGPNYGSTNDQRGFSYSFGYNNATFVAVDQYFYYDQPSGRGGYHELDRTWVTQQFQQTNSAYKVLMAHEPFFMTTGLESFERFFGTNAAELQVRADFWNATGTNGLQLYVTGHVHSETVARTTNDYGNSIIQLLAGNGGAPVEVIGSKHEPGVEVLYTNSLFGFALATVGDTNMTIQYYLLHTNDNSWTVADYVTQIFPNQLVPEASSAILLAPALMAVMSGRRRRACERLQVESSL